jgi:hypothetical protein
VERRERHRKIKLIDGMFGKYIEPKVVDEMLNQKRSADFRDNNSKRSETRDIDRVNTSADNENT